MNLWFFPFSIRTSKCSGSSHNINYPYAKHCVPDVVKNLKYLMLKYLIYCHELMKQAIQNGIKLVNVNVNVELMFVIINNVRIKLNADVNVKN